MIGLKTIIIDSNKNIILKITKIKYKAKELHFLIFI